LRDRHGRGRHPRPADRPGPALARGRPEPGGGDRRDPRARQPVVPLPGPALGRGRGAPGLPVRLEAPAGPRLPAPPRRGARRGRAVLTPPGGGGGGGGGGRARAGGGPLVRGGGGARRGGRGVGGASRLKGSGAERQRDAASARLWEERRLETTWELPEVKSDS